MKPTKNVDELRSYLRHRWPDDWPVEEVTGRNIRLVANLRDEAIEWLRPVLAKVSCNMSDDNKAAFADKKISTEWKANDLAIADKAYAFCCAAGDVELNLSQRSAVDMLSNCTFAIEKNAVPDELLDRILSAYEGLNLDAINTGSAVIDGGELGREKRDQNNEEEKTAWRIAAKSILSGRKKKPGQREFARLVAKQLNPLLTDEGINKLADSRRNWIKDLL